MRDRERREGMEGGRRVWNRGREGGCGEAVR